MNTTFLTGSKSFWVLFSVIVLRYLILASIAFLIYYVIKRRSWLHQKIQQHFPRSSDYWREILYSIVTSFIFTAIGLLVFATPFKQFTQAYSRISDYGMIYFIVSILMMIIVHDTYFYWIHRWMHREGVFKWFHKVHHLSTNPSPWAAFAFHPLEAVVDGSIITVVAVLFPVHPLSLGIFILFMMV